jgi:hypothetical protein
MVSTVAWGWRSVSGRVSRGDRDGPRWDDEVVKVRRALARRLLFAATLLLLLGFAAPAAGAGAFGGYTGGSTGRSVFYSSCGSNLPASVGAFALINVTGGRAFYQNPCLVSQFHWAQGAGVQPSLVMNLNAPAGTTAFKALTGPKGTCVAGDQSCLSYNYGFNAAAAAFADATSQGTTATRWWLDIEAGNSWDSSTSANASVIQGAIDALQAQNITVGLYSSAGQWQQIAGAFAPGLPNWVAGASGPADAPGYCSADHAFAGGTVWLAQYPATDVGNMEYACGGSAQPAPASATSATTAPAAPRSLTATATSATTIRLTWTVDPATTDGVGVYDDNGSIATLSGPAAGYMVKGLQPGTQHCYNVYAFNGSASSGWSGWSCATTPAQ